jgi:hypothetical protein
MVMASPPPNARTAQRTTTDRFLFAGGLSLEAVGLGAIVGGSVLLGKLPQREWSMQCAPTQASPCGHWVKADNRARIAGGAALVSGGGLALAGGVFMALLTIGPGASDEQRPAITATPLIGPTYAGVFARF